MQSFRDLYGEKVWEMYQNLEHKGSMENPDIVCPMQNNMCGDWVQYFIRIEDNVIKEIKYDSMGCALSLVGCELAARTFEGKKIEEVLAINNKELMDTLGTSIEERGHCTLFSIGAFKECLEKYLKEKKDTSEKAD